MQAQVSLLVIHPCWMIFRWETADVCVVQPATAPASPWRKMLFSGTTQRWGGPTLCRAFSSLLGIQSPKEGTFTSLLAFPFGVQTRLIFPAHWKVVSWVLSSMCPWHLRDCTRAIGLWHSYIILPMLKSILQLLCDCCLGPPHLGITDHSAHRTGEMLLELLLHPEGWVLRAGSNLLG